MFIDYYQLREQPFGVTPDPRYLYLSRAHREALASLYYGVEAGRGFMALIADPGMGKTTLLFQLLEKLPKSACTAFLFQTQCDSLELLHYLLADMGVETCGQDLVDLHTQLNQALSRMFRAGRRFVLVIDEAQNLDSSVLETVRLLSNFETPSSKLMQIILSGQPQLADKLASPRLVQLRQRIAFLGQLEPFGREDVEKYIRHRLRVAGHDGSRIFTSGAMDIIAAQSLGIPRNINNLCFNALSLGCALRRQKIDRETVLEAVRDLEVDPVGHARHSVHVDVPPAPTAEPCDVAKSVRRRRTGRGLYWSAALGAASFLAFLLLFPSVRRDCRTSFPKAFTVARLVAQPLQHGYPAIPPSASDALNASKGALADWFSGTFPRTAGSAVPVEVKPWKKFQRVCVEYFWRFDRWLSQRILAHYSQLTDLNHIEVGQRSTLPRRTSASTGDNSVLRH